MLQCPNWRNPLAEMGRSFKAPKKNPMFHNGRKLRSFGVLDFAFLQTPDITMWSLFLKGWATLMSLFGIIRNIDLEYQIDSRNMKDRFVR